jgi:hypothetical protein
MNITAELDALITSLGLPVETGKFSGKAPEEYVIVTPLVDAFALYADNRPEYETQEARLSLYSKKNYQAAKRRLVKALLQAGFTITLRQYVGREDETGFFHYTIDAQKLYRWESC